MGRLSHGPPGSPEGIAAICEHADWEELERCRPGYHKLVLSGIRNEREAEMLARAESRPVNPALRRGPSTRPPRAVGAIP